jgi:hypothetical protein
MAIPRQGIGSRTWSTTMTHFYVLHPRDRLDREQPLMNYLVTKSTGCAHPQQQVIEVFAALNDLRTHISTSDYTDSLPAHLRTVLVAGAILARTFGVPLYDADEWPDGQHTRIGGDGALATGHHPLDLLTELADAATWVATFVHYRARMTPALQAIFADTGPAWLVTEPLTELIARTWCLADSLAARETLRDLILDHLCTHG